ncbi:MAG: CppA family protein [Streptococcaceae bacterium]|jgi:catechol 2,3-dioxygenase-like lactoylglutathione lyase family enzyme|nr:CppA family protein [Streptococcaceae bacterium]
MSVLEISPVYRVNDREENLKFFRNILGMKVLLEEGAMIELGGHQTKKTRILLEESPADSGFAKNKTKIHRLTVLRANVHEIVALLEKNKASVKEFEDGEAGFEAVSPEGDVFWLLPNHPYKKVDTVDFIGLSDFEISEITLNVANELSAWESFAGLLAIVDEESVIISFEEEAPEKLENVWDIEALEIQMSEDTDFEEIKESYRQFNPYLDAEKRLLNVSLPEGIELWFEK